MKTGKSDYVCPKCGYRKPAPPPFRLPVLSGVIAPPNVMGWGWLEKLFRAFCPRCGTKMKKEK